MAFCSACGTALAAGVKFCNTCGTPIAGSASAAAPAPSKAGSGLSANKGDDWLPSAFRQGSYTGTERQTDAVLGAMIDETNRVFGQLGVSVAAAKRTTPGSNVTCPECTKPINGAAVEAMGKVMHPQCFQCSKCHSIFDGESYTVRVLQGGATEAWCAACLSREKSGKVLLPSQAGVAPFRPAASSSTSSTTSSTSGGGGLTASQRDQFLSRRDEGKTYCAGCREVMMADGVVAPSGTYHPQCFKCAKCSLPVSADTPFATRDGKPYHPACASNGAPIATNCTACSKPLIGKFVRASNQAPYHAACFVCSKCSKDLGGGYTMRNNAPHCGSCASAATPYITSSSSAVAGNKDMGGIRYNQVTREVTRVAAPNCVTSPVKNPGGNGPQPTASAASAAGSKFCQQCGAGLAGQAFCSGCGCKA